MSYTDLELYTYSLTFAQKVVFFDLVLYRYFVGREGQSVSIESYRKILHKSNDYLREC